MEDALAHRITSLLPVPVCNVLILVLMEDALALADEDAAKEFFLAGLNPCFNGRCTRTFAK